MAPVRVLTHRRGIPTRKKRNGRAKEKKRESRKGLACRRTTHRSRSGLEGKVCREGSSPKSIAKREKICASEKTKISRGKIRGKEAEVIQQCHRSPGAWEINEMHFHGVHTSILARTINIAMTA